MSVAGIERVFSRAAGRPGRATGTTSRRRSFTRTWPPTGRSTRRRSRPAANRRQELVGLLDVAIGSIPGHVHVPYPVKRPVLVADHGRVRRVRTCERPAGSGAGPGGRHEHPPRAPRSERKSRMYRGRSRVASRRSHRGHVLPAMALETTCWPRRRSARRGELFSVPPPRRGIAPAGALREDARVPGPRGAALHLRARSSRLQSRPPRSSGPGRRIPGVSDCCAP